MFSDTLLDHFQSPRNVGEIERADAEADAENPICGDRMHLWLSIKDGVIERATWRGEGCAPALAAASVVTEMLQGMTVDDARALSRESVAVALGGLPARKAHAASLAASTVQKAIAAYEARTATTHN
jgi:nitrogen fixation NifU-like protein